MACLSQESLMKLGSSAQLEVNQQVELDSLDCNVVVVNREH